VTEGFRWGRGMPIIYRTRALADVRQKITRHRNQGIALRQK
jgi:hypothetical protein